jgi:hypothetical protein
MIEDLIIMQIEKNIDCIDSEEKYNKVINHIEMCFEYGAIDIEERTKFTQNAINKKEKI